MVGFGAGLTWAAAAVEWSEGRALSRSKRTISRIGYGLANMRSRARRIYRRAEDRIFGVEQPERTPAPIRQLPAKPQPNGNGHPVLPPSGASNGKIASHTASQPKLEP